MNKVKISIVFKKKWLPLIVCSKREAKSIIKNLIACGTEYKVENCIND